MGRRDGYNIVGGKNNLIYPYKKWETGGRWKMFLLMLKVGGGGAYKKFQPFKSGWVKGLTLF